jgi:hypothetical protein
MRKGIMVGIAVACLLLVLALAQLGYCIHLKLGSDALYAWGSFITGIATLMLSLAAIVGGLLTVNDYAHKVSTEKAKWLFQLYEKLFENGPYKEIRRKIDFDDLEEIKRLIKMDRENLQFADNEKTEFDQFTDYLNFFEFIAYLHENNQLTSKDIKSTFEYYLRLLTGDKNPEIRGYLEKEGFEKLTALLAKEYETQAQAT